MVELGSGRVIESGLASIFSISPPFEVIILAGVSRVQLSSQLVSAKLILKLS